MNYDAGGYPLFRTVITVNHPKTSTVAMEKPPASKFFSRNVLRVANTANRVTSAKMITRPIYNPPLLSHS